MAKKYEIDQIVATNVIDYSNMAILRDLALRWEKVKKFKNDGQSDERTEKGKKYMEDLLKLIRAILEQQQIGIIENKNGKITSQAHLN